MVQVLLRSAWHLISRALPIDAAILGIVALVLLIRDSWPAVAIGSGLFWGGVASVSIGGAMLPGGYGGRGAQYGRSATNYIETVYGYVHIFVLAGTAAIGLSFAVTSVFPSLI